MEGDYFDELRRTQTIMNDDSYMANYDLDMSDHVDELPITSPAVERSIGRYWRLSELWARSATIDDK